MVKSKYTIRRNVKRRQRSRRILPLLLTVLVVAILIGYQYRDSIYAYWEADKPPASGIEQELEQQTEPEDETTEEEEIKEEEIEEVEEAVEEIERVEEKPSPSTQPSSTQPAREILQIKDGNYLLALVTKQTSLGKYEPADLVTIPEEMRLYDYKYQLREEAYLHLREMWEAAKAAGSEFYVNSAYRSYATQKRIFNDYAAKNGEKKANEFSARPGQSEHQLGTTVDLGIPGYALSAQFGSTSPGQWLKDNAYKYGFVMSYPEGSKEITGYIYEPWHFRYIGVENAKKWKESGLVLCQFLELQPQQWK